LRNSGSVRVKINATQPAQALQAHHRPDRRLTGRRSRPPNTPHDPRSILISPTAPPAAVRRSCATASGISGSAERRRATRSSAIASRQKQRRGSSEARARCGRRAGAHVETSAPRRMEQSAGTCLSAAAGGRRLSDKPRTVLKAPNGGSDRPANGVSCACPSGACGEDRLTVVEIYCETTTGRLSPTASTKPSNQRDDF
jgi:hypothetical protein